MEDEILTLLDSTQEVIADLGGVYQAMREDGRHDNAVASYVEDLFMFSLFAADEETRDYPEEFLGLLSALLGYQFTSEHAQMAVQAAENWKGFSQTVPYSLTLLLEDENPLRAAVLCDVYLELLARFSYLFRVALAGANPASCFQKIATIQDYCEYTLGQRGVPVSELPWRQRHHEGEGCFCGCEGGHHGHHGDCGCGCEDGHHHDDCGCGCEDGHHGHHGHHQGGCGCGCSCE